MLSGQVLPNRIDHLDGYRIRHFDFTRYGYRRLVGVDWPWKVWFSISSRNNIDWKLSRRIAAMTTMTITATATIIPMSF